MMLYPNSVVAGAEPGTRDFRIEAVNNLQLSAGSLRLRSADPDVAPEIDLGLLSEPRDRDRLVDAIERALALAETTPLRDILERVVLPDPTVLADPAALDSHVERTVMTGQHISSSCRMGADGDPMAVVHPTCRVRGVTGLRIVDGSIMPDSVRANTHATILAMAELMAGRISAEG
jgi:choline dehydrogenase